MGAAPSKNYSAAADGQSFLVTERVAESPQHDPLVVILNWTALLHR